MKNTIKISSAVTLIATAVLSALRSICMFTCYDSEMRYFEEGLLPLIHTTLYIIGILACVTVAFILPKDCVAAPRSLTDGGSRLAMATSPIFFICGILLALGSGAQMRRLELLAGLLAIVGALFFLFSAMSNRSQRENMIKTASPWLCIAVIAVVLSVSTAQ